MKTKTDNKMKNEPKWFIFSNQFKFHFKLAVIIFIGILVVVGVGLKIFTLHYNSLDVPDFKLKTITEVQEICEDNNLRYMIIDSVFTRSQIPGTIVDQEPKPNTQVKKNRRIFLYINAYNPEKIKMPNVVGVSLRQAIAIIESSGLLVGSLRYVPDIATNNVLNQKFNGREISPSFDIIKGSKIDLVLGKAADGELAKVPDLLGFKIDEAKRMIAESYLNTGAVIYDNTIKNKADSLKAFVFKQSPKTTGNANVGMGAFVDVWLTIDDGKLK
jgi:beta-lactam-binding protein with PASTA domain